jgi:hypothetical protein
MAFQRRVSVVLDEWLVDHIVRSDGLMKPFTADMKSYAEGAISLAEAVRLGEAEFQERRDADGLSGRPP